MTTDTERVDGAEGTIKGSGSTAREGEYIPSGACIVMCMLLGVAVFGASLGLKITGYELVVAEAHGLDGVTVLCDQHDMDLVSAGDGRGGLR